MLNRVINGTKGAAALESFVSVMRQARTHRFADAETRKSIERFLERFGEGVD